MPLNKSSNASDPAPACGAATNFWVEDFTLPDGTAWDDGATWDNKGTIWTVYNGSPNGTFAVSNNEFKMNNLTINGASYWQSDCISIAGKLNIQVSVDVRSAGDLDNDATNHGDYLRLYYKLDGGSEVLFAENLGKINNNSTVNTNLSTAALGGLNGSTIQIVIRGKATAKDEWYYFDNVKVTYQVPVNIQPSASVTQQITCSSSLAVLSGGSAITGASYSWTGPDGFSTAVQNPTVSVPGDYVLTVTDPASGCTSTATATVTQVLTQPASVNAIATNQLTCAQHSATLTGSMPPEETRSLSFTSVPLNRNTDRSLLPGLTTYRKRPSCPKAKAPWFSSPCPVPVPPVDRLATLASVPSAERRYANSMFASCALLMVKTMGSAARSSPVGRPLPPLQPADIRARAMIAADVERFMSHHAAGLDAVLTGAAMLLFRAHNRL